MRPHQRVAILFVAVAALTGASEPRSLDSEVQVLRRKVAELEASRDSALRQLEELRATLAALQRQLATGSVAQGSGAPGTSPAARAPAPATPPVGSGPRIAQATPPEGARDTASPEGAPDEVGQEKAEQRRFQAERAILERQGGVLVPAGQLVVEPAFTYTYGSRDLLDLSGVQFLGAIFIGRINVAGIDREVFSPSLDLRYGLHRRVEFEANIPYAWRTDQFARDVGGEDQNLDYVSGNGIGDIQFGLFTQLLYQQKWWPDVVLNVQAKAPTGKDPFDVGDNELPRGLGTWGLSGGLTFVRTLDPAVVFGSIRYLWDIEEDFGSNVGTIDYGDTVEYSIGLAMALNERLALTMSLQHSLTDFTRQEFEGSRRKLVGSNLNAARLFLGGSYRMSELLTINLNAGVGITEDAPDFQIELSVPLRLPYRFPHL